MYSQTKRHNKKSSKLLFVILFILNFNSLRTQSNTARNDRDLIKSSIQNSSCIECLNRPIETYRISSQINSSNATTQLRPESLQTTTTAKSQLISRLSTPTSMNYFARRMSHSIAYRSTPNLVLLSDSMQENGRRPTNNRKKQLDLEFESPNNMKTNLNYNLDDLQADLNGKESLKQNIDRLADRESNIERASVHEKNISTSVQSDKQESSIVDKQSKFEVNQQTNSKANGQYRHSATDQLPINRRPKNPRQSAIQSSYSVLRRFHPINHINQLANVNRYTVEDARLATLEIAKLQREGKCKFPSKRTIPISKLLSKNLHLKKILPHCTILYRCESDTGCCSSDGEHCTVKKQEIVRLPFWVIELNSDGQQFKTIEWHSFMNHTECGCESKS